VWEADAAGRWVACDSEIGRSACELSVVRFLVVWGERTRKDSSRVGTGKEEEAGDPLCTQRSSCGGSVPAMVIKKGVYGLMSFMDLLGR